MIDNSNLSSKLVDGVVVVTLKCEKVGEFEAPGISADVDTLCKTYGWRLVLDLTKVEMLASRGIGMFLGMMKVAQANKGKLALAALTPEIYESLKISSLTKLFTIKDTVEDAVRAIK